MKKLKKYQIVLAVALMLCFGALYPKYLFVEGIVKKEAPIESILTASANQIKFRFALLDLNN